MALTQEFLKKTLQTALKDFEIPSISVSVWDGERQWDAAEGMADIERGVAATPDTLYAIGSSTKAFAAATFVLALEEHNARVPVTFLRSDAGRVTAVEIPLEPELPHDPIHFTRAAY